VKTILITGGAGFIGSHFIRLMAKKYPEYEIINLDLLTYAGNLENLWEVELHPNYFFMKGDISDPTTIRDLFAQFQVDYVVNFAAESHVDRSIADPDRFLRTNVIGTNNLLRAATEQWEGRSTNAGLMATQGVKFLQISTDEVYGSLGKEGRFHETTPLHPNSPYSASKASADLLVQSYHETYGLPVNITRCSNNYGSNQHLEKFIPLTITRAIQNMEIPIYGDGLQIRDWVYVDDHCDALDLVLHKGMPGEVYNIGGDQESYNILIAKEILRILGKPKELIRYVKDRPGHDQRYAVDHSKITRELDWKPKMVFQEGLKRTIQWYLQNTDWVKSVMDQGFDQYLQENYQFEDTTSTP
jgi:dTDP-glucose 4,6-dehydratase